MGGVYGGFGGDFVFGALTHNTAVPGVETFGPFPDHDEINLARVGQRAGDARVEAGGAQVHVVVEGETHPE